MKRLLLIIFIFLAVLPAARYAHGDTMDHLEQAYHAQREGDYESAIDHYSRLLKERTLRTSHRAVVYLQAILKNGIWPKVKEEVKRQPEEYMKYFEDWLFTSDAEIGV
jgi:hypothetical protein